MEFQPIRMHNNYADCHWFQPGGSETANCTVTIFKRTPICSKAKLAMKKNLIVFGYNGTHMSAPRESEVQWVYNGNGEHNDPFCEAHHPHGVVSTAKDAWEQIRAPRAALWWQQCRWSFLGRCSSTRCARRHHWTHVRGGWRLQGWTAPPPACRCSPAIQSTRGRGFSRGDLWSVACVFELWFRTARAKACSRNVRHNVYVTTAAERA